MKKIILAIEGMTCSACSNGLEKYLNKQEGVNSALVNLVMANATIEYDEDILNQEKIEKFIEEAGFKSLGVFKEIKFDEKSKKEKITFIVYTILAIFLMYVSMGHMLNLPVISFLNPMTHATEYMICLLFLAGLFIWYGFDILKNGYKNLIHKTPNMDTLVAIGVITSFLYSIYNMILVFRGDTSMVMNLYFESSAIVIYFIKLGRYIDSVSKDKTKRAISSLLMITPTKATVKNGKGLKEVDIDEIKKGDIVVAKAGEKIAVDGVIISGSGHLDEAFITGESKPLFKEVGDKVIAGSVNFDGYIEYKAERIGRESTISEIVRLVIEATNTKAPIAKVADKVASIFVPVVILIAICTFLGYLIFGSAIDEALITFVTILVVACPCSLGLATPLAIIVSEGVCATNGILIKKSEILEIASKVDTVIFDKTGTLTYGKLKIAEVVNYGDLKKKNLLEVVCSIESKSNHPIAKAFTSYLKDGNLKSLAVHNFENIAGYGIVARVNDKEYILGNAKILKKYKIKNEHLDDEERLTKLGNSVIYVAMDRKVIALIAVGDIVREESEEVIKRLSMMKIDTIMLTGDNDEVAKVIAKKIGISKVISNVTPDVKAKTINDLKKEGKLVMMCGDGINDSPALASSDIGVSVTSGTDIAMDSSDVILTNNDLLSIVRLFTISKRTIRNIKENLFWAFFYNTLMIPVAMGLFKGLGISINPVLASIAMILSSLTVIFNALRLRTIKL